MNAILEIAVLFGGFIPTPAYMAETCSARLALGLASYRPEAFCEIMDVTFTLQASGGV